MCGISGILNLKDSTPINLDQLKRMTYSLRHRGPDETGVYIDNYVGLAQSRLSIIDLSSGSQPIHNEDKSKWIIFNGEIFNYPEIRYRLLKNGHKFYTTTDTEVILHLYEDKKEKCLDELNGQFVFVIWDSQRKEFFIARDRVGILPLFYKIDKNKLIFASEVKAIIESSDDKTEINPLSLEQVFTFWTTLPGKTVFNGINELSPGHYIKSEFGKQLIIKKYWEISYIKENICREKSLPQFTEEISDIIIDSIKIRLRADVPVGSYLSGGIDSSGITALIKSFSNNNLRTFGITFEETNFDESKFQKIMVDYLKTDHSEINATNENIGKYFFDAVYYGEKPILRTSPVPLYMLSQKVRHDGIKVVLTGEGADEVFGGYNIFRETKVRKFWSANINSKYRALLFKKLYPYIFNDQRIKKTLQSFFSFGIEDQENPFFSHIVRWHNSTRLKNFFSSELRDAIGNYNCFEELKDALPTGFNEWNYIFKAQYLEIILFMSNYLLSSQGDRMAMANSVELRVPYLDHRLIEYMSTVPAELKIRGLNEKYLLKKVFYNILPKEIIYRSKNPYRAPIKNSLVNNKFLDLNTMLSEKTISAANIFDPKKISLFKKKVQQNESLSEIDNMTLAGILSTQILYDHFIKSKKTFIPNNFNFNTFIDKRYNRN